MLRGPTKQVAARSRACQCWLRLPPSRLHRSQSRRQPAAAQERFFPLAVHIGRQAPDSAIRLPARRLRMESAQRVPAPPSASSDSASNDDQSSANSFSASDYKPGLRLKDGRYQGRGTSPHGDIVAEVVIQKGQIAYAGIADCLTRYSCSVIKQLPEQVVVRQSIEVDLVSGASESTDRISGRDGRGASHEKSERIESPMSNYGLSPDCPADGHPGDHRRRWRATTVIGGACAGALGPRPSKRRSSARLPGFARSKSVAQDSIRGANWRGSRRRSASRFPQARSSMKRCGLRWRWPKRLGELSILRSAPRWRRADSTASIAAADPVRTAPARRAASGNVSGCAPRSPPQDDNAASSAAARSWRRRQRAGDRYGCARTPPLREFRDQRWRGHLRQRVQPEGPALVGWNSPSARCASASCAIRFAFLIARCAPLATTSAGVPPKPKPMPAAITSLIRARLGACSESSGCSAQAVASVTVVAPTAMLADALATAAFVLGPAEGIVLLERFGLDGFMISPTLERHATRGMCSDYEFGDSTILPDAEGPASDRSSGPDCPGRAN